MNLKDNSRGLSALNFENIYRKKVILWNNILGNLFQKSLQNWLLYFSHALVIAYICFLLMFSAAFRNTRLFPVALVSTTLHCHAPALLVRCIAAWSCGELRTKAECCRKLLKIRLVHGNNWWCTESKGPILFLLVCGLQGLCTWDLLLTL